MTVPAQAPVTAARPLAGLRVIEVASFVAGPLGGMTLAQLGADVIRVDPLGGAADYTRWPLASSGASIYWAGLNKAKRSLSVDLRSAEGQDLITRLITGSGRAGGIVLTNAPRPWLSYETLSRLRSDVIHLRIDGYPDGRPAVDYTVNAELGFPLVTGPEDHPGPVGHVLPAWDIACGLYAAIGLLGADRQRRLTGHGQELSVALYDVALASAGNLGFLGEAELNGVNRPKAGNYVYGSFARDFTARDGDRVMVVALTPRHWKDLVEVSGLQAPVAALESSLGADFSIEGDRYTYREVLAGLLQHWFGARDLAEITAALGRTSVLWSVYRSFTDVVANPGTGANPMMGLVDQPGLGRYLAPSSPIRARAAADGEQRPVRAPVLGEHSAEILRTDLGLDEDHIEDLQKRGVVSTPRS
ncbi:MAG TPA: CoA transferase [Streptosporangiaceae bacterium]|nr:CoA transferase [Streptosporangiaceae bacterium]